MTHKYAIAVIATLLAHGPARAADPPPVAEHSTKPAAAAPAPAAKPSKRTVDRLQLDPTAITGNRELPKVMNIVPWKAAEPPAGPDRPLNSLVEEALSPLDRDEFRREITYYRDLTGQSAPVVAPGATQP
jgi:hypothetical protein